MGSTATFDGCSDDSPGGLKGVTRLKGLFRGPRGGGRGGAQKVLRVMGGFKGILSGHQVGLMGLLLIHKAYRTVYKSSRFLAWTCWSTGGRTRGPRGPKK